MDIKNLRQWNLTQRLSASLWARLKSEYLPLLQRVQKWIEPHHNLTVGDVVLLKYMDDAGRWLKYASQMTGIEMPCNAS